MLRPYQQIGVDFLLTHDRSMLFYPMGSGKSLITLSALEALDAIEGNVFPALVVAPLRVAQSTWPEEAEKWYPKRRVQVITGDKTKRIAALLTPADIYCVNFESLTWLEEEVGKDSPFKTVIVDECSKLKGFRLRQGTKRSASLAKLAHLAKRYIGLTGTPASNGLIDLWGPMHFVDKGERLGRSFDAFKSRFFQTVRVGQSAFAIQLRPLPTAQKEIEAKISDKCLSFDAASYFNLDEPIVSNRVVKLPAEAYKKYREMERELFTEIQGEEIEAFSAAAKSNKCLQLASGAAYINEAGDYVEVHDAKLEALEEIIEEACGMPVLVAYQFKSDKDRILKRFPQARYLDKDPQTIKDWNAGKIPVLLAHPASAGHGLSLQHGGNILVFFSLDWNLENRLQIVERIGPMRQAQSGYKRPVYVYNIIAGGTFDEVVLERIETKKEVVDLILEAMERNHD